MSNAALLTHVRNVDAVLGMLMDRGIHVRHVSVDSDEEQPPAIHVDAGLQVEWLLSLPVVRPAGGAWPWLRIGTHMGCHIFFNVPARAAA